jgi:hypothetical protein
LAGRASSERDRFGVRCAPGRVGVPGHPLSRDAALRRCSLYTQSMSKRLQVLLDDAEWRELREAAGRQGLTVSEWVRRTLREAHQQESTGDVDAKLRAVRQAVGFEFPTADIDQMLDEIERGYLSA